MKRIVCAVVLAFLAAVAVAEPRCRMEARFDTKAIDARVLVIGEGAHGTNEIPAFVGGVLCSLAVEGRPVILAWEFGREKQPAINAFMESDGSESAREALIETALRTEDGRSSVAIVTMLEGARALLASGARIAVEAVDFGESDVLLPAYATEDRYALMSQNRRQALMAVNVEELSRHYDDHAIVFFTAHAGMKIGEPSRRGGAPYESAALRLSRRVGIASLGFRFDAGSTWRCMGPSLERITCAAYPIPAGRGYDEAPLERYIDLGPITASPPASKHPDPIYRPPEPGSAGRR